MLKEGRENLAIVRIGHGFHHAKHVIALLDLAVTLFSARPEMVIFSNLIVMLKFKSSKYIQYSCGLNSRIPRS